MGSKRKQDAENWTKATRREFVEEHFGLSDGAIARLLVHEGAYPLEGLESVRRNVCNDRRTIRRRWESIDAEVFTETSNPEDIREAIACHRTIYRAAMREFEKAERVTKTVTQYGEKQATAVTTNDGAGVRQRYLQTAMQSLRVIAILQRIDIDGRRIGQPQLGGGADGDDASQGGLILDLSELTEEERAEVNLDPPSEREVN